MKAFVRNRFGSPDVLELQEVDKPELSDGGVLVRVRAASVNPADWYGVSGTPLVARVEMGLLKPKSNRLGIDYAGTVEAVGRAVTQFQTGDEVFGGRDGAFAEYVCARADRAVVLKPANLTFEQAAAVPVAAITALQGLRDKGQLQPGQKVLINGASGGVGTFAVQIAKALGAEVTGVCSTRNVDLVRSLGADHVVDYSKEDFTRSALRPDARYRREQVVESVQASAQAASNFGHCRGTEGQSSDGTPEPRRQAAPGFVAQQPESRLLHREAEQGRHDDPTRASGSRKSDTGHRQELRVRADYRRFRLHGRGARAREDRRHHLRSIRELLKFR